ncbi:TonB-dependent receptor plug [Pseudomonas sp. MT-1]|nr:TonB-dependent receptor plug [Pseudomonas sp. MT-1]
MLCSLHRLCERLVRRFDYWDGIATADTEKLPLIQGKLPNPPVFSFCYLGAAPMPHEALLPREENPTTKARFCHVGAMPKMTTMRSNWGCLAQVFENNGGSHE